ncbi:KCTD21 [Branchiostoma lanceolatum]|uniref:KCTD21 protein n=1 Tax=Branchiostoma lanceolatum TaxID=7740 RepID=A0A8J9YL30_BRALA|nr:KCTD21 [Branchiostoma lanceolatum]
MSGSIVTLNVGGHFYTTARSTLTRYPDSMLGAMLIGDLETLQDDQGRYFIDRDGTLFRHVLNFLRTNQLVIPEDFKELPLLEMEADFYQIQPLIEAISSYKARLAPGDLGAHDVIFVHSDSLHYCNKPDVVASSNEVDDMVKCLMDALDEDDDKRGNLAILLKWIQDKGFSLHGYTASADERGYAREQSLVLVRKNAQNSTDN